MNNKFNLAYDVLKTKLYAGYLAEVESGVTLLEPTNLREQRMLGHLQGVVLMRQGHFEQAIQKMNSTIQKSGSNIGILIDLAASYYLGNQFFNFNLLLNQVHQELAEALTILSPERKAESYLQIAKFLEEKGELAQALQMYQEACTISREHFHENFFRINYIRTSAQILRLSVQYNVSSVNVANLYHELLQHSVKDTDFDCEFEVEHALIHAETRLFDLSTAMVRFTRLQKNPIMHSYESELIYADLVYDHLINGRIIPAFLKFELEKITNKSVRVLTLLKLCNHHELDEEHINHLSKNVPAALYIRLLMANLSVTGKPEFVRKRIILAIQAQSTLSRKIWFNFMGTEPESSKECVIYDKANNQLTYQGKPFSFDKQQSFQELIDLLVAQPNINTYDAVRILWNSDGAETDMARLRMRIYRLNKKLMSHWTLSKLIEIEENKINLKVDIKLT